jgi:hypothetical protein
MIYRSSSVVGSEAATPTPNMGMDADMGDGDATPRASGRGLIGGEYYTQ